MRYGLAAVRHQHMPGQCVLSTVPSEVGKDRVVSVRDVVCGAVSRHQHHATTHAIFLALLNAVMPGAVFSESMLASACCCQVCSRRVQA